MKKFLVTCLFLIGCGATKPTRAPEPQWDNPFPREICVNMSGWGRGTRVVELPSALFEHNKDIDCLLDWKFEDHQFHRTWDCSGMYDYVWIEFDSKMQVVRGEWVDIELDEHVFLTPCL
jgi:hypothetical protein